MATNRHWVLPQGIEEALPEQAALLESARRDLLDMYRSWGYELVMPPFIEHIESLLTGAGHDLDLQTFKIVDQMTGRTLGLRADMTPQVARIDAHQLNRDVPTRLCYIGTVLRTRPDSFGGSRSPLQVGAELYGHSGVEADVEMIGLMLSTFERVGVEDVYVDLGNVDIFRGLARQADLDEEVEATLFEMLQRKAVTEISQLLSGLDIDQKVCEMLSSLAMLNGGQSVLDTARAALSDAESSVMDALDYLGDVADRTRARFGDINLHFDLAELTGYHYQTGVVFAAFVPQSGQAIARGGRYDAIGEVFGRARAATGFSSDLKTLVQLSSMAQSTQERVFAPVSDDASIYDAIDELRNAGIVVVEQLPGQSADAAAMGCDRILSYVDGEWRVTDI